ncbi:leucine-rich repeat domain-containing protein [Sinobacterium caligoides]|nr:leucine-rich repeat domain-containing protein [Sinobacterium caligoides]
MPKRLTTSPINRRRLAPICLASAITLLGTGCADYSFTVNDNVVYTPPTLFSDFTVSDPQLKNCLQQNIIDQQVTAAEQLTTLSCSNANIHDLAGIEQFTQLQQVNLNNNAIADIAPLGQLKELTLLLLNSNEIVSIRRLLQLKKLDRLEVKDNPNLTCQKAWPKQVTTLRLPEQCD